MKKLLPTAILTLLLSVPMARAAMTIRITNAGSVPATSFQLWWSTTTTWTGNTFGSYYSGTGFINPGATQTNVVSNGWDGPDFGGLGHSPYIHVTWYTNLSQVGDTGARFVANTAVDGGTGGLQGITAGASTWLMTGNTDLFITVTPGGPPAPVTRRRATVF